MREKCYLILIFILFPGLLYKKWFLRTVAKEIDKKVMRRKTKMFSNCLWSKRDISHSRPLGVKMYIIYCQKIVSRTPT